MLYKKMNRELIVLVDEAVAALTELNAAARPDRRGCCLFHGDIEIAPVDPVERIGNQDDHPVAPDEWRVQNDRLNNPMRAT